MFGRGSKTIVGLDVGSSSIKAVELRKTRTGIEVAHLGLEPIAPDLVVDSMIVDSGQVSTSISKLFMDTEIKSKTCSDSAMAQNRNAARSGTAVRRRARNSRDCGSTLSTWI